MKQAEIIDKVRKAVRTDPNKDYIKSVYLFGSYLHGDAKDNSDVDLLFEMKKTMTLFQIGGMQYHLEQTLGKKVDFIDKDSVIPQLRDKIIQGAKKIYERK